MMKQLAILLFAGVMASVMSGCSTWRCRGFVNVKERSASRPTGTYKIASVKFVEIPSDPDKQKPYEQLAWFSHQDVAPYASYREDLAKSLGFTNETADAVSVNVIIAPALQSSEGWKTVFWPLCGTLGVIPAHFSDKMPFEVKVEFGGVQSRPIQAMVCTDRQYGLSRYDMDMPPTVDGASAEILDDGTVGTGSELRDMHQREVFVRTVADTIRQAIAEREKLEFKPMPTLYTEFGPVIFPEPIKAKVKPPPIESPVDPLPPQTPLPDVKPSEPIPPVPFVGQEKEDAFDYPLDQEEKTLKALLLSGLITKEEWRKLVAEHRAKNGQ